MEVVSQESSKGGEAQREETSQVQTAIEQMILATEEVANSALNAAKSADESKLQAESGQEIVGNASNAFASLASEVENASGVIQQLQENRIVKVFDHSIISFSRNFLLNFSHSPHRLHCAPVSSKFDIQNSNNTRRS